MKKYTKENLKSNLQFDIYYTDSLNLAYLFPHLGYKLTEDILLDNEIVHKDYLLFYNNSGDDLKIFSPDEKIPDVFKVGTYDKHLKVVKTQPLLNHPKNNINIIKCINHDLVNLIFHR
jgi:hypothetical protein